MNTSDLTIRAVTGALAGINPVSTIPLIIDTVMGIINDYRAKGLVTDEEVSALRKRITDVTNKFQDIAPFK